MYLHFCQPPGHEVTALIFDALQEPESGKFALGLEGALHPREAVLAWLGSADHGAPVDGRVTARNQPATGRGMVGSDGSGFARPATAGLESGPCRRYRQSEHVFTVRGRGRWSS